MAAAITVSGAAMPAAVTIVAKPKKKLIAGAMFASVAAAMSKSESTPRASRAGGGRSGLTAGCADAVVAMPLLYPCPSCSTLLPDGGSRFWSPGR
jgi:hypothetical protein